MIDSAVSIFIIILGFAIVLFSKKRNSKRRIFHLSLLWVYHLAMNMVFYQYSLSNSNDASGYWRIAKESTTDDLLLYLFFGPGTKFMYIINYYPAKILDLSFYTGGLMYCLTGFLGFVFLYELIITNIPFRAKILGINILPIILFLPNMHFWTSHVGKDTLLFFAVTLVAYSFQNMPRRILGCLFGLTLSFLIRPHIAVLLVASYGFVTITSSQMKRVHKGAFILILTVGFILVFDTVLQFAGLQELSVEAITERSERQIGYLSSEKTNSAVDMSNYPFLFKLFTFLFRPLFVDAPNALGLIVSVENLMLVFFTVFLYRNGFISKYKSAPFVIKGLVIFFLLGSLMFSLTLGNLGIMIRMKNMLMPGFILFIFWSLSVNYRRKVIVPHN